MFFIFKTKFCLGKGISGGLGNGLGSGLGGSSGVVPSGGLGGGLGWGASEYLGLRTFPNTQIIRPPCLDQRQSLQPSGMSWSTTHS